VAEQSTSTELTIETARAKPLTGSLLGILIGLAVAIVIQQQGIWPLDRLTVFLLPAVTGLIGLLLTTLGRRAATGSLVVSLVLLLGLGIWGATALGTTDERGQINGGCTVEATSSIDSTTVTDTSRGDPFDIDPHGSLSWETTSPTVFEDYAWEIWVDIAGFQVVIDGDVEDNEGASTTHSGSVDNVSDEADARGIPIDQLRGVFKVGGFAATCDGFLFVSLASSGFLETMLAKSATIIGLLLLIILLLVAFTGRKRPVEVPVEPETVEAPEGSEVVEPPAGDAALGADGQIEDVATDPDLVPNHPEEDTTTET